MCQRLLAEHRHVSLEARDRRPLVELVRRGDDGRVEGLVLVHLLVGLVGGHAVRVRELRALLLDNVDAGRDDVTVFLHGVGVTVPHVAQADDADPERVLGHAGHSPCPANGSIGTDVCPGLLGGGQSPPPRLAGWPRAKKMPHAVSHAVTTQPMSNATEKRKIQIPSNSR